LPRRTRRHRAAPRLDHAYAMKLSDDEKAMLDGRDGAAVARAMDLLVRYGEALGADALVETRNVCGTFTATTPFMREYALEHAGRGGLEAVYSEFNLDSDEVVALPSRLRASTAHLQMGFDPQHPQETGASAEIVSFYRRSETMVERLGVRMVATCAPYQVGIEPAFGEHIAWMESSAVVYANSVLGARGNCEGRESTNAAALTGRIPNWGLHLDAPRRATLGARVRVPIETVEDWGLFGYWYGEWVQERVGVIEGLHGGTHPDLPRLKHFGAAASSSGGVELYHLVGITPEAASIEHATGGRALRELPEVRDYDATERERTRERLNATANDRKVDFVMLGCPHHSLAQLREVAALFDGRRVHGDCAMWIFTARAIRDQAQREGVLSALEATGVKVLTDTCSAMSRSVPKGTRVVALDSAKQAHYLPAITGVQAWFGTTSQCIDAACTGRWGAS
jgi:predicted aconitase